MSLMPEYEHDLEGLESWHSPRRRVMRAARPILVVGLLVGFGGVLATATSSGPAGHAEQAAAPSGQAEPPVPAVASPRELELGAGRDPGEEKTLEAFSVLRDAPQPELADATSITHEVADPNLGVHYAPPSSFSTVATVYESGSEQRAIVAISPNVTCFRLYLASGAWSGGCGTTRDARNPTSSPGAVVRTLAGWEVALLLPDVVSSAQVITQDDSATAIPIQRNFALAQTTEKPTQVVLTLGDGSKVTHDLAAPDR